MCIRDRDNINATFDDESLNGRLEDDTCNNQPAFGGPTYTPHGTDVDSTVNPLSDLDFQEVSGTWDFTFENNEPFDTGNLDNACITVQFAAITFDQWISTDASCSGNLDAITVVEGTNLFTCYSVSNDGDESFNLALGDITQTGIIHDLSALTGNYTPGQVRTVTVGPLSTGSAPLLQGTTIGTTRLIVRGTSTDFPASRSITTNEVISVTVSAAGSGNKPLYLYNNSAPVQPLPIPANANYLSRVAPTTNQGNIFLDDSNTANNVASWILTPALQLPISLDASQNIPVDLYISRQGGNDGTNRLIDISIDHSGGGGTNIGSASVSFNTNGTGVNLESFSVPITGASNIPAGETISLTLTNPQTQNARRYRVFVDGTAGQLSQIVLPSDTVIDVTSVSLHEQDFVTNPSAPAIVDASPLQTVFVRAAITDPFGSFDINAAEITVTTPTPTTPVVGDAMSVAVGGDDGVATRIFEYSYTLPLNPEGTWNFSVTAREGTENTVTDVGSTNITVASPSLMILKSTQGAITSASPGDTITYIVTVTNAGLGRAKDVTLNDSPSPFVDIPATQANFSCTAGCTPLVFDLGTVNFTLDSDGDVSAWDVIMAGDMPPSSAFTIEYGSTVE